jgi:hypothetical protein
MHNHAAVAEIQSIGVAIYRLGLPRHGAKDAHDQWRRIGMNSVLAGTCADFN